MKAEATPKKHILFKTNLLVSSVIVVGFLLILIANNKTEIAANRNNMELVSALASKSIYYRLESIFMEPLNVALTMANNSLLVEYLSNNSQAENHDFTKTIQIYLNAYREKYGYDSVFFASAETGSYYNYNGLNRVLTENNPENEWYYNILNTNMEYSLNIDNDEAAQDEITVFVNSKIADSDGTVLGVVGVGFLVEGLQHLLIDYADASGIDIYLINEYGDIEIAIDSTGWQPTNFFDTCGYSEMKDEILNGKETGLMFTRWIPEETWQNYVVTQYIPELNWHLIIEHNTAWSQEQMRQKLMKNMLILFTIGLCVLSVITYTINRYNKRIIELIALTEQKKHAAVKKDLIQKAETDGLTGFYNKLATEYYVSQMLLENPKSSFAFYMLDMDSLKKINDTHGHAFGDFVISKFASIIKSQFRDGDIIGRIGGDEFVIFLPVSDNKSMVKKVENLSKALYTECSDGLHSCTISASIGVAIAPYHGEDFQTLYKNADTALYQTKSLGKNSYTIFDQLELEEQMSKMSK